MNTNFLSIINRIIAEQGEGILAEPQKLKSLIKDYAQDEPKPERLAFGRCVEYGAYNALKTCGTAEERQSVKTAISQRVHDGEGLDKDLCAGAMDIIEAALFGAQTEQQPETQRTTAQETGIRSSQTVQQPPVYQQTAREKIKENSELRALARQQLHGVWKKMAFVRFIYFFNFTVILFFSLLNLLASLISLPSLHSLHSLSSFSSFMDNGDYYSIIAISGTLFVLFISIISIICLITFIIVSGTFTFGFTNFYLKKVRGENIELKDIFTGFTGFSQSFMLIIPGIINSLSYSMAFFIMADNPNIKPLEAIKKSKIMMAGNKFQFFCLLSSFIGWFLLCYLSLGIGFFWLHPYMGLSIANFYENLKEKFNNTKAAA